MVKRAVIERVDFLSSLSTHAKETLAARAVTRRVRKGQRLWTAGDEPRGLFVVLTGSVRILRTAGGRQHVVHSEGAGATLGEIPLFGGGGYPATAVAAADVELLVIDRPSLAAAVAADPELAWTLLARLAQRVRHLLERLSAQTADPVVTRLAAYLLARPVSPEGTITLNGSQEQLAEELGTVREVVVRTLGGLVRSGAIARRGRGRFAVLDRRRLSRVASSNGSHARSGAGGRV